MFNKKAPGLIDQGVNPIYVRKGKKVRIDKKENELVTHQRIKDSPERAQANVGIKGEHISLFDFDVFNAMAARYLLGLLCKELNISQNDIIVRYGNRPKFGVPFIFEGSLKSSKSATYKSDGPKPHQLEIKANGTYWVAFGFFIDDGERHDYTWEVGGKIIEDFSLIVDDLPVVTQENVDNIYAAFEKAAKKFDWPLLKKARDPGEDWFIDTDTMGDMSIDKMRYYLDATDSDEWLDYDGFTKLGMAIYHQTGGSEDGLELYVECCERTGEAFDEDECHDKWESYNAGDYTSQPVRFHGIVKQANGEHGTSEAGYYKEAIKSSDISESWQPVLNNIVSSQWMSDLDKSALLPALNKKIKQDGGDAPGVGVMRQSMKAAAKAEKEAVEEEEYDAEYALSYLRAATMDECDIRADEIIFNAGDPWIVNDNIWYPVAGQSVVPRVYDALSKVREKDIKLYNTMAGAFTNTLTLDNVSETIYSTLRKVNAINIKGKDPLALTRQLPMVINCLNRELWFDPVTGEMVVKKHNLKNYFTFGINAEYDPKATCPKFDKSLDRIFDQHVDSDYTIAYLFELFGYLIQPTRKKAMFLLWKGSGSNGKTFVSAILSAMMGGSVLSLSKKAEDSQHFTASLVGKGLIVEPDFDEPLLSEGMVKKYTESKLETANPKFGTTYQFRLRTSMLILSNSWPRTKDMSSGVVRRAQVIDFNTVIPDDEADLSLEEYIIENELPGVLNRCIEGLQRLIKNGYLFTESDDCTLAKEQWLTGSNPLRAYLHERCTIVEGVKIVGSELFADYQQYIGIIGGGRAKGRTQFYKDIADLKGVLRTVKHKQPWFMGITLVEDREDLEEDMFKDCD